MQIKNGIAILIFMLGSTLRLFGQDARVYYEGTYYRGPFVNLTIGQSTTVVSDGDEISIDIIGERAAVKVTKLDGNFRPLSIPNYFFVYTEQDFPEVFGTDQYENCHLRVECLPKAGTWRDLPQPQIFVPFDFSSKNPNPDNDHHLLSYKANHRMLVLRRAFFWENSEDIGGLHGPYGDIKIGVANTSILSHSDQQLVENRSLWEPHVMRGSDLSGPIWSGYAPIFFPDPYDEWIDGPFGCIYSNIAVWDWGVTPNPSQKVAIVVSEADSPNSYMGRGQFPISPEMEGEILVKVWGFGWVVLENIWVPSSGKELSVAQANVYWYGGWDGQYPVNVYGPQGSAVPCESCPGNQFRPFTDAQFWNYHRNSSFFGQKVGLLGGKYPAGTLNTPHTYLAIDQPVVFGRN